MQKQKKIPQRMCCGCGEMFDKRSLVRVVRSPEGEVSLDFTGKASGRGAYICQKAECFKKAKKSGRIARTLQVTIPEEIYSRMEAQIKGDG